MKRSEKIVAFAAIFISYLALFVSIIQTRIIQKLSHAAVWPRLDVGMSFGPDYFDLNIENSGVGPAISSDIEYSYKDSSFHSIADYRRYLLALEHEERGTKLNTRFAYSDILNRDVLTPTESIEVFSAIDTISIYLANKYFFDTSLKVDYCSIYDKSWRYDDDGVKKFEVTSPA